MSLGNAVTVPKTGLQDHSFILVRVETAQPLLKLRRDVFLPDERLRAKAAFSDDAAEGTRHYGTFIDRRFETAVCCGSIMQSFWCGRPVWQLRGLATEERFRKRGLARTLLHRVEIEVKASGAPILWCDAEKTTAVFYEKLGWQSAPKVDYLKSRVYVRLFKKLA